MIFYSFIFKITKCILVLCLCTCQTDMMVKCKWDRKEPEVDLRKLHTFNTFFFLLTWAWCPCRTGHLNDTLNWTSRQKSRNDDDTKVRPPQYSKILQTEKKNQYNLMLYFDIQIYLILCDWYLEFISVMWVLLQEQIIKSCICFIQNIFN